MTPNCAVVAHGGWRRYQAALLGAIGASLIVLPWWSACRHLLAVGYSSPQAPWLSLVLAICLEMIWLPSLAIVASSADGSLGWRGFAAIFAAAASAAAVVDFIARGSFLALWAQAMCLSVAALAAAVVRSAMAIGISPSGSRCLATAILAGLWTNPFWARLALEGIADAAIRNWATQVAVWLAPIACLSIAFEGFNFATDLGRIYSIWLGPVVPYPPHPLAFAVAYLLPAGALYTLAAWLGRGDENSTSTPLLPGR